MNPVFEPFALPHMELKNRIARSATHDHFENPDDTLSKKQLYILKELAENDVGLIFTGHMYVSPEGEAMRPQISLCKDSCIPQLEKAVQEVHRYGSKLVAQISHAGPKATVPIPLAPSRMMLAGSSQARQMNREEIERVKKDFISAAVRVKAAGFDGVQVHMAHHYLLSCFITPGFNRRKDEYGGNAENRFRLPYEILTGIHEACGPDFPVFVKINSNVPDNDAAYGEDLLYMMREFRRLDVEAVEISGYDFRDLPDHRNYYLERAAQMRKEVDIPVILVGGIRSLQDIDEVLSAGIDIVSLCRPFISQPDLVSRMREGWLEESRCIGCNQCSILPQTKGLRCVYRLDAFTD